TSEELQGWLYSVALSPDGQILASGGYKVVRLWDTPKRTEIIALTGHDAKVFCLAFSHDGKVVASGDDDGVICLWDTSTGKQLSKLKGHRGGIRGLAFSSDGKALASSSLDTTVLLWDVADILRRHPLREPSRHPANYRKGGLCNFAWQGRNFSLPAATANAYTPSLQRVRITSDRDGRTTHGVDQDTRSRPGPDRAGNAGRPDPPVIDRPGHGRAVQ